LERLVKQTTQLSQYHSVNATPCRASFSPLETSPGGPFHSPSVKPKLTVLPPSPFLVPAVLEALLRSSQYQDITEVVPGEADLYCAKYLSQHGGIVFTGDSDLLVHNLGKDGAVTFFKDIQYSASSDTLGSQIYKPAVIAQRLDLPKSQGLHAFAFELLMDSHGTFRKLLIDAQSLKAATANPSEFKRFLKEYKQLPTMFNAKDVTKILPLLRSLDPRISEYVLQYPYLARLAGREEITESSQTLHAFLPFLLDCPVRTNAWEVSTAVRQLAYGLINLIVPVTQQRLTVSEHRKQQDKSTGRELQLPSLSQIPEACTAITILYSQLRQSLPGLSEFQIWTAFALHQEFEYSYSRAKTPLSKFVIQQLADLGNKSNMSKKRKGLTWDIIQFFAQIQGSYYSFRILKQISSLVVCHSPAQLLPEPLLHLHQQLDSLPKLCDLVGLDCVSSIIGSLGEGAILIITSHVTGGEEETQKPQESRRALKKKRKRGQSAAEASASSQKPRNPFELLGDG
jgi:XPG domain containing